LPPFKLRTADSHFATLPVRHRASGVFVKEPETVKALPDWAFLEVVDPPKIEDGHRSRGWN
jgi:hypothetical protein